MIADLRRGLDANPFFLDALIAGGLTALSLLAVMGGAQDAGDRDPLSVVLLLMQTVPLVLRRRYPLGIFAITAGATFLHALLAVGQGSLNESLGSLVALYTVADRCDRRTSIAAAFALAGLLGIVYIAAGTLPAALSGGVQTGLSIVLAWAFGDWARTRRLVADLLAERDRQREAERDERAARAVERERERIARELHDVVTHHVSVMVIQAGAAQRTLGTRPAQARGALEAIEQSGRQALTDMRRMLGILGGTDERSGSDGRDATRIDALGGGANDQPAPEPQPGLDRLGELIERVRAAGMPVEVAVDGDRRRLDDGIELSAYRIVQEALTNALKYARGARARVDLRYRPDALEIEVSDDGGASVSDTEPAHDGRGLIGMRERVAMLGGRFEAGPTDRGFRVAASLPLEADPRVGAR